MKKAFILFLAFSLIAGDALARGGFSSGGGRGGFSSSRSYSSPSRSYSAPSRPITRSTTTTVTRSSSYRGSYSRPYYGHPYAFGGMGMGYGYSNGLIEGMIIGNMMHPQGTVLYNGGGYNGDALLYPDGRVVNAQGYQVGMYQNGQFAAQQGGMVAQPAPQVPAQPVIIEEGYTGWQIFTGIICVIFAALILIAIFV